jgi:hypothetical protein
MLPERFVAAQIEPAIKQIIIDIRIKIMLAPAGKGMQTSL